MRFTLIDQIVELNPQANITARKSVTLAEEYLADHFPMFPVLPGVLMLEAMTQAGAWLIRASEDFAHSLVLLKEARNVKYADFVAPGETLVVRAEITDLDAREVRLKTEGQVGGETHVSARLVLERYNLADERPEMADMDRYLLDRLRKHFSLLYRPAPARVG